MSIIMSTLFYPTPSPASYSRQSRQVKASSAWLFRSWQWELCCSAVQPRAKCLVAPLLGFGGEGVIIVGDSPGKLRPRVHFDIDEGLDRKRSADAPKAYPRE